MSGKVEGWREKLQAVIVERTRPAAPFRYGTHDCAAFAAACIEAQTGVDVFAEFRGQYDGAEQANALVRQHGSLRAILRRLVGPSLKPERAGTGDVAMIEQNGRAALGVFLGERIACAAPWGVGTVPRDRAILAWQVG